MKKLSLLAVVALSATFFACSDDSSSGTSGASEEKGVATCKVTKESSTEVQIEVVVNGKYTETNTAVLKDGKAQSTSVTVFDPSASEADFENACKKEKEDAEEGSVTCKDKTITSIESEDVDDAGDFKDLVEMVKDYCDEVNKTGEVDDGEDEIHESSTYRTLTCISAADETVKIQYLCKNGSSGSEFTRTEIKDEELGEIKVLDKTCDELPALVKQECKPGSSKEKDYDSDGEAAGDDESDGEADGDDSSAKE